MTNEELLHRIECMRYAPVSTSVHAYDTVIDEMERRVKKQMPAKPRTELITEYYQENIEYYCPTCETYITSEYGAEFSPCCSECGQRIDWSEDD